MSTFTFPPNCTKQDLDTFSTELKAAATGCAGALSYDWTGVKPPTASQYTEICPCSSSLKWFRIPNCSIVKDTLKSTIEGHFNWVVKTQCGVYATAPICTVDQVSAVTSSLDTASNGCIGDAGYDWGGDKYVTNTQLAEICKCMSSMKPFEVPKCNVVKSLYLQSMEDYVLNSVSKKCNLATPLKYTLVSSPSVKNTTTSSTGSADTDKKTSVPTAGSAATETKTTTPSPGSAASDVKTSTPSVTPSVGSAATDNKTSAPLVGSAVGDDKTSVPTAGLTAGASSSSNTGLIIGIAGGVIGVLLIIILIMWKRKRKSTHEPRPVQHDGTSSPVIDYGRIAAPLNTSKTNTGSDTRRAGGSDTRYSTLSTASSSMHPSGTGSSKRPPTHYNGGEGMWDDPVIVAARIPRDTIFFGPLLSRGGYGEVFRGTYMGEAVAIKQLLPARRKDLKQIDDFLGEVKLMSGLEHERIVRFIGVAWNSLSDACMVVEYMENGDLRSVLSRWDEGMEQRSTGFDADKIKIALHVAHALTYLHSMQPVVVHRDLKSRNILLDENLDAKLTDFGISRERAESTMTAGVGSSLWMAPEVMMGERYDEKADVFSFGVVLSELDTHQLPYFQAKDIPETAILQQVMLGRLSVSFSDRADQDLAQLGRDCVSLSAKDRPTAANVLHRVHLALQKLRQGSALI